MSTSLHITLAGIAMIRGRHEEVSAELSIAAEVGGDQDPYAAVPMVLVQAQSELWRHRPDVAWQLVTEVLPVLQDQDDPLPVLEACRVGLWAAADLGRAEKALWRLVVSTPAPSAVAAALRGLCAAEHARADGRDAPEAWLTLAEQERALGRPLQRAYALYRAAAAGAGDSVRKEAAALAETLGAEPLLVELAALTAGAARPYSLTSREQEVLTLLSAGQTNREISRSLFISDRTAGVHVSNILAKLHVTNRTEAAGLALRDGLAVPANLRKDHHE